MHDLVNYVHNKYKDLPKDFNFTAVTSKNLNVEKFYRLYSEKVALKNKNIGWHPAMLKHAVHLDFVHIFASLALENPEFDAEDNNKLQRCLRRCNSDSKDRRMHPFSKLMIAIKSKYTKIDDNILR